MGTSFQAPHVTPRQRQMEMHHDSLIIFIFQYASMTNHTGMYKLNNKVKIMIIAIIRSEYQMVAIILSEKKCQVSV